MPGIQFAPSPTSHVYVTLAHDGGWDIHVERDGRNRIVTHCTDWHRVERWRARLEAEFGAAAHEDEWMPEA